MPEVSEIIISDDCSDAGTFVEMKKYLTPLKKVRLYRNKRNLDCYYNKKRAMYLATNPWAILLDSDNMIGTFYVQTLLDIPKWDKRTIYTPDAACPNFIFTEFSDLLITRANVHEYIDKPLFQTMLNACNYFVNREEYVRVWDGSIDPVTSDSIWFCLQWLEAGNSIKVVNGLQYIHRVHADGHYQQNIGRTPAGFHDGIMQKLRDIR